jgi:hypothetical protein
VIQRTLCNVAEEDEQEGRVRDRERSMHHHRALCKNAGEQGRVSGEEVSEVRRAVQKALCAAGERGRVRDEARSAGEQCSEPWAMRTSKAESFRDEARTGEECSEPCAMRASEAKSEAKRDRVRERGRNRDEARTYRRSTQ